MPQRAGVHGHGRRRQATSEGGLWRAARPAGVFPFAFAIPVILWLAGMAAGTARRPAHLSADGHFLSRHHGHRLDGAGVLGAGAAAFPEVTAIGYAAPLMVVIFAAMFLGEDVRLFRLSMVVLA